jgi:hypothetical protein
MPLAAAASQTDRVAPGHHLALILCRGGCRVRHCALVGGGGITEHKARATSLSADAVAAEAFWADRRVCGLGCVRQTATNEFVVPVRWAVVSERLAVAARCNAGCKQAVQICSRNYHKVQSCVPLHSGPTLACKSQETGGIDRSCLCLPFEMYCPPLAVLIMVLELYGSVVAQSLRFRCMEIVWAL